MGDAPQALALLNGLEANIVMADTAYDSDALRASIAALDAQAVIPNNPSRKGFYDTTPQRLKFHFSYQFTPYGWKLYGLSVRLQKR